LHEFDAATNVYFTAAFTLFQCADSLIYQQKTAFFQDKDGTDPELLRYDWPTSHVSTGSEALNHEAATQSVLFHSYPKSLQINTQTLTELLLLHFYGSLNFVWDSPGKMVIEETFTNHTYRGYQQSLICFLHLL